MTLGPRGVHRTRLCDPMTGISRRCNGRAVAALCRCGSRPHRSEWAQGPVVEIEGLALDPLVTSLRHAAEGRR
jgi:hypothetical protein